MLLLLFLLLLLLLLKLKLLLVLLLLLLLPHVARFPCEHFVSVPFGHQMTCFHVLHGNPMETEQMSESVSVVVVYTVFTRKTAVAGWEMSV